MLTSDYSVLSSILLSQTVDWNIKQFFNKNTITSPFQLQKIGKALKRRKDQTVVSDEQKYKRITIKTNCNGVVVRDELLGKDIKTKNQYYVRTGQLAVSKIDARNGAFGIVPPEADGAIITGNFWVYDVDSKIANIDYLILLLSSEVFVQVWQDCSNGSGNRLYLQENKFLDSKIPLPILSEQNKIVSDYYRVIEQANSYVAKSVKLGDDIENFLVESLSLERIPSQESCSSSLITKTSFKSLVGWGAKLNSNPVKPQALFKSKNYTNVPIEYFCEINPKTDIPHKVSSVSFVPMECVSDIYGKYMKSELVIYLKAKDIPCFKKMMLYGLK